MKKEIRLVAIGNLREKIDSITMGSDMNNLIESWYEIADDLEKKYKEKGSLYLFMETEQLYNQLSTHTNNFVETLDRLRDLVDRGRA